VRFLSIATLIWGLGMLSCSIVFALQGDPLAALVGVGGAAWAGWESRRAVEGLSRKRF
jgi:hypothetical protein